MSTSRLANAADGERRRWCVACAAALILHVGVATAFFALVPERSGARGDDVSVMEIAFVPLSSEAVASKEEIRKDTPGQEEERDADTSPEDTAEVEQDAVETADAGEPPGSVVRAEDALRPAPEPFSPLPPPRRPSQAQTRSPVDVAEEVRTRPSAAGSAVPDAVPGGAEPREVARAASGLRVEYSALLRAWLERHRQYPYLARVRRQQGTATLAFVIDRTGRVLEFRLQRSSGHGLLDREVTEMIARAQPLPPVPESIPGARFEFVVPILFRLD